MRRLTFAITDKLKVSYDVANQLMYVTTDAAPTLEILPDEAAEVAEEKPQADPPAVSDIAPGPIEGTEATEGKVNTGTFHKDESSAEGLSEVLSR